MKGFYFISPLLSLAASHSWQCHRSPSSADPSSASKFHHLGIMDMDLHKEQSQKKVVKKSSKSGSAATALHKINHKISKRSSEYTSGQRSFKNSTKKTSNKKSDPKITFKDQRKHRLVLQDSNLPDGLELHYISKGKILRKGYYRKGRGVLCCHCNQVVSPTMFESHAGRPNSRKPYQHIFLSNGMSLHQYAASLKPNCQKGVEKNDKHDGFVSGVGPSEPIAKQGIQIDGTCDQVACVLCRSCDFSADGFSDQTSIVCDQCEKEYHIGCLRKDRNMDLKELPADEWFCTEDCKGLHLYIKSLTAYGSLMAEQCYQQLVKNKIKGSDADSVSHGDVRWFVFSGMDANEVEKLLLTQAVDIFHECFSPIIDVDTGTDFIPSMAYGKQMGPSNFSGVYSAMLTIDLKVVTAGMFRVFGRDLAELSIVATSKPNQGKGYFQIFFDSFERLLSHIEVKKLVIPAADNAKAMWIKKFGFKKVPPNMLTNYRQTQTSMVTFQGTTLLQRDIRQGLTKFRVPPRFYSE